MTALFRDIRLASSALLRRPGTTAVIILTLALGIGANSAIFSLLNAVVLRPLPVPHPEQLVGLATTIPDTVNGDEPFSLQMFQEMTRNQHALLDLFAWNGGSLSNAEVDGNRFTSALATVSGDYYKAMRIRPLLGRFISPSDVALESGTSSAVAVISFRLWRARYHGDPYAVGKVIRVGSQPFTVIGVEPEGYSGLIIDGSTDVTVPLFAPGTASVRDPRVIWLQIRGRLYPGLTLTQARASLETLWPAIQKLTVPPGYDSARSKRFFSRRIKVESASNGISYLRTRFSHPLAVLLALVASLLLIGCLNLANLSIAKMAAQQHTWAVKLALGAGRWDLVRPVLVESFVVALAGAFLGLATAFWTGPLLLHVAWSGRLVNTPLSAAPDLRVLAFTAGVALVSALLFAIVPAWYATHAEAATGLRQNARAVHGGSTHLGKILLTAQVALSLVLVAGALLFGETLVRLHSVDAGYRRDHLLTMLLFPQSDSGKIQDRTAYYHDLAERVRSIPGVASVSYSNGGPANQYEYRLPIYRSPESNAVQGIDEVVGPDFFTTMGMKVLTGREFAWNDDDHSPKVAVVSKKLAEQLYGDDNPVGRDLYWGVRAMQQKLRIVGMVNSASLWKVESVEPAAVYRPLLQATDYDEPLMDIRTLLEPSSLKGAAERIVRSLAHHYSLQTTTLDERLDHYITAQRLMAVLAGFFGIAALLIAAVGLFGLMSFHVTQRTTELAVRLALGAQSWQVFSIVLGEVVFVAGLGCAIGLIASISLRSYVASILFGVSATDPIILGLAILILVSVALLAGILPARHAASVNPAVALRRE